MQLALECFSILGVRRFAALGPISDGKRTRRSAMSIVTFL